MLSAPAAHAQIVHEKPGKIKAANRRAQREAQNTDSPYKDSHLEVAPNRLKRGKSPQNTPEGSADEDLRYKTGTAPNVKPPGLLGLRRTKESTLVRKEQRQRGKGPEKAPEKK